MSHRRRRFHNHPEKRCVSRRLEICASGSIRIRTPPSFAHSRTATGPDYALFWGRLRSTKLEQPMTYCASGDGLEYQHSNAAPYSIAPELGNLTSLVSSFDAPGVEGWRPVVIGPQRCAECLETCAIRNDQLDYAPATAESLQLAVERTDRVPHDGVRWSDCWCEHQGRFATAGEIGARYGANSSIHVPMTVDRDRCKEARQRATRCDRDRQWNTRGSIPHAQRSVRGFDTGAFVRTTWPLLFWKPTFVARYELRFAHT